MLVWRVAQPAGRAAARSFTSTAEAREALAVVREGERRLDRNRVQPHPPHLTICLSRSTSHPPPLTHACHPPPLGRDHETELRDRGSGGGGDGAPAAVRHLLPRRAPHLPPRPLHRPPLHRRAGHRRGAPPRQEPHPVSLPPFFLLPSSCRTPCFSLPDVEVSSNPQGGL